MYPEVLVRFFNCSDFFRANYFLESPSQIRLEVFVRDLFLLEDALIEGFGFQSSQSLISSFFIHYQIIDRVFAEIALWVSIDHCVFPLATPDKSGHQSCH